MAAVGTAAFVVGLGVALAVLAMAAQARAAQRDLAAVDIDARAVADQVLNGHLDAARTTLGRLQQDARAAQRRTRGFLWVVGEHLPLAGRTPQAIATLADSAVSLAEDVLPQMLRVGDNLALDAGTSKRGDTIDASQPAAQIDLHRLQIASDALVTATRAARQAVGRVDSLHTAAVFSPVRRRVIAARVRLDRLVDGLEAAAQLSQVTAGLLGGQGRRSYLIALQNSAEARGTGGLAGAFVVLTADRGKLRIGSTGVDDELDSARAPITMLGAPYRALYGTDAALWANANLSPYFPTAARLWLADWRQVFRTRIDGVIATDPSALAGLLSALGPIRLHPHGEVVNAANVVSLTERDLYVRFAHDNSGRKAFLLSLLRQVTQRALHAAPGEAPRLFAAAGAAANNGRFLAYSTRPDEEAAFERLGWAGVLPALTQPSLRLSVDNAGGNKLDYYLRRQLRYELGRCAGRMRPTTVTALLTNAVPEGPLPHYAASRSDVASRGNAPAASNRLLVYLHLTAGAGLQSAELDARRTPVHVGVEQGHPVVALAVDLRPGESRRLVLHLLEPKLVGAPIVQVQPLVQPQQTDIVDRGC